MDQQDQGQGIPIDPAKAFENLQQYHGMEMARLAGDVAAKNTFIMQLQQELKQLQEHCTALEQNQSAKAMENGAHPSGADLKDYPLSKSVKKQA